MIKNQVSALLFLGCIQIVFSQIGNEYQVVDFTIAFGSCNQQTKPQPFWSAILDNHPDLFIWGGDNIYADSSDTLKIAADYQMQANHSGYKKLV